MAAARDLTIPDVSFVIQGKERVEWRERKRRETESKIEEAETRGAERRDERAGKNKGEGQGRERGRVIERAQVISRERNGKTARTGRDRTTESE